MEMMLDAPARWRAFTTDDFGLTMLGEPSLALLIEAFTEAVRAKNRSGWVMGDAYIGAEDRGWLDAFSQALDPAMISLRTIQNCASTCRAFPKDWRRVPLSMSHYQACARLVKTQTTEALALLTRAYDGGMSREWVREQVAQFLGEADTSAEIILTYDRARDVFVPSFTPDWLADGYSRTLTVRP